MNPKPDKLIPALYGGIIMGVISAVPVLNFVNCLCCAGIMLGGFTAVMFYKNSFTPEMPPLTTNECMTVGALAGVFGAVIGSMLTFVFIRIFGNVAGEMLVDMLHKMNFDLPEEAWDKMEESLRESVSPLRLVLQFFFSLILDPLFGLLGGLIGYSVYKSKQSMIPPPSMPPPTHQQM